MSLIVEHPDDWPLQVPHSLVNDNSISIGARFLLIVIWSLQSEKFDVEKVSKVIKRNPKTTYKYLNELVKSGYINRTENGYEVKFEK